MVAFKIKYIKKEYDDNLKYITWFNECLYDKNNSILIPEKKYNELNCTAGVAGIQGRTG